MADLDWFSPFFEATRTARQSIDELQEQHVVNLYMPGSCSKMDCQDQYHCFQIRTTSNFAGRNTFSSVILHFIIYRYIQTSQQCPAHLLHSELNSNWHLPASSSRNLKLHLEMLPDSCQKTQPRRERSTSSPQKKSGHTSSPPPTRLTLPKIVQHTPTQQQP